MRHITEMQQAHSQLTFMWTTTIERCLTATGVALELANPGMGKLMDELSRKAEEYLLKNGCSGSVSAPVLEVLIAEPELAKRIGVEVSVAKIPMSSSGQDLADRIEPLLASKSGLVAVHVTDNDEVYFFQSHAVPNALLHFQQLLNERHR